MAKSCKNSPDDDDKDSDNVPEYTEDDILEWVHTLVWSGENDAEEIQIIIGEELLSVDEPADEKWLKKIIKAEIAAKRKAEKKWPKVTDWDRLELAFEALREQGIFALHAAGFTQSDGLDEVEQEYEIAGGKKSNYAGHCFYTEQDMECAIGGGGIFIGFGHLTGKKAKGLEVGQKVREALEEQGFKVIWNGTIAERLYIPKFRYQRRGP